MKKYKMPFDHWLDDHAEILKKERGKGSGHPEEDDRWWKDAEWYCKQHFHYDQYGNGPYFLNKKGRRLLDTHGPFTGNYVDGEEICDTISNYASDEAVLICPGPSSEDLKSVYDMFEGKHLTVSVNSAGFAFKTDYWVMAESEYAKFVVDNLKKLNLPKKGIICTARVATLFRAKEKQLGKRLFPKVYVVRWEEEFIVPARVPAVSVFNALVSIWQIGAKKVDVFGLDLSRPKDQPYMKGVAFTQRGATNTFDHQIKALNQFQLPDFRIYNQSPHSKKFLNFDHPSTKKPKGIACPTE